MLYIMSKILAKSFINSKYKQVGMIKDDEEIKIKMVFNRKLEQRDKNILNIYCHENNLRIIKINELFVDVKGKILNINRIFQTDIMEFRYKKKTYYSEVTEKVVPYELNFVGDVIGLNNLPIFRHYSKVSNLSIENGYTPVKIGELYDFPLEYRGSNRNIAIIELGGGYRQTDLEYYFLEYLKNDNMPTVIPIPLDGATNNPSDPASDEVVLDIEVAGAIAKCATIAVYFSSNSYLGFYDAVYFAITNLNYRPCAISISWGLPELESNLSFMESMNLLFYEGYKNSINIFCASGDYGSSDGLSGLNVDFPASSPYVIGCGGTTIDIVNNKIVNETVWSGTGGGYSKFFGKPVYQDITGTARGVPDIAGNADPNTGYIIYMNGVFKMVGGTSAVAPLYAGLNAICSQPIGTVPFMNGVTYLYRSEVCYDIVEGNNGPLGKWDAKVGWDPCTGNGRIYGVKFLARCIELLKTRLGI